MPSKILKISERNRCSRCPKSWLSLVMKKSSVSRTRRLTVLKILCYALERWTRTHNQIMHGKSGWRCSRAHHSTELWTTHGEPMEFDWNILPGFTTLQLLTKFKSSQKKRSTRRIHWTDYLHVDVRRHFMAVNRSANLMKTSFLFMREDFHHQNVHSSDLDQWRNGFLLTNTNHKENGTELRNWWS